MLCIHGLQHSLYDILGLLQKLTRAIDAYMGLLELVYVQFMSAKRCCFLAISTCLLVCTHCIVLSIYMAKMHGRPRRPSTLNLPPVVLPASWSCSMGDLRPTCISGSRTVDAQNRENFYPRSRIQCFTT
jgi:hypothetical protein